MTETLVIPTEHISPSDRRQLHFTVPAALLLPLVFMFLFDDSGRRFLLVFMLLSLPGQIRPLVHRAEIIFDHDAHKTRTLLRKDYLFGMKVREKALDASPYTRVEASLVEAVPSLELCAPGKPPLVLSSPLGLSSTRKQRNQTIRLYRRMSRDVAQALQIEDRGLHRFGRNLKRSARNGLGQSARKSA